MRVTLLAIVTLLLQLTLSRNLDVSLDAFLRDLPSSDFNFSDIVPGPVWTAKPSLESQQAWDGGPPLPAEDALWCRAKAKGTALLNGMSYTDADAGLIFNPPRASARSDYSRRK